VRKVFDLSGRPARASGLCPSLSWISFKSPHSQALTIVAKDRLPVFKTDAVKRVTCEALNEPRTSAASLIFAYVIMTEHIHIITSQGKTSAEVLRYVRGITGRRVIDYLNDFKSSLAKLEHHEWKRKHKHSLWQQEKNVFPSLAKQHLCKR